jgi:hypothetical protein
MRHYLKGQSIDTVQVDDGACSLPWESHTKVYDYLLAKQVV